MLSLLVASTSAMSSFHFASHCLISRSSAVQEGAFGLLGSDGWCAVSPVAGALSIGASSAVAGSPRRLPGRGKGGGRCALQFAAASGASRSKLKTGTTSKGTLLEKLGVGGGLSTTSPGCTAR